MIILAWLVDETGEIVDASLGSRSCRNGYLVAPLSCHPANAAAVIERIRVHVESTTTTIIIVKFKLTSRKRQRGILFLKKMAGNHFGFCLSSIRRKWKLSPSKIEISTMSALTMHNSHRVLSAAVASGHHEPAVTGQRWPKGESGASLFSFFFAILFSWHSSLLKPLTTGDPDFSLFFHC